MGRNGQDKTTVSNKFNIPVGIVARRREELIAAKLAALVATPESQQVKPLGIEERESVTRLNHLTESRPIIPHRPPTRRHHREFLSAQNPQAEITNPAQEVALLPLLKNAISFAENAYREQYQQGTNHRKAPGWFSYWRHGDDGQQRAGDIFVSVEKSDTAESILHELDVFFNDPLTRYNNNSFASYLLDELNKLVQSLSFRGCNLSDGEPYNSNSWKVVAEQLIKLVPVEPKSCAHVNS